MIFLQLPRDYMLGLSMTPAYRNLKFRASPDCENKRNVPDDCCAGEPLNKTNCVVKPPPSAKCGKNRSEGAGADSSLTGGRVVIKNSFLSL